MRKNREKDVANSNGNMIKVQQWDGTRSAAEPTGRYCKALREKTNADQEDASMVSDMAAAT